MSGKEIVVVPRDVWQDLIHAFDNAGSSLAMEDFEAAATEFEWIADRMEEADVVTAREANLTTTDV
jgi:hypothetical protein